MDLKVSEINYRNYELLASMSIEDTMIISAVFSELEKDHSLSNAIQNVVLSYNEFCKISDAEFKPIDEFKIRKILKNAEEKGYCRLFKRCNNNYNLYYM
ncbi:MULTISPECIES: hypothetical protein [Bacillus cereus group]|uniref:hypothetical protein n=1 Tax=Bacillus cereus group TaxID=86661 RepID=UPI001D138750|nr:MULTISPECIES: hypothetical protein [Bacillus cereus group]MCC2357382.1 hypothetical protein [Bacillus paranthracis]MCC3686990.1 hypothetical protein [Bacillus cereus]